MAIERYMTLNGCDESGIVRCQTWPTGAAVKYEDHVAEIVRLRKEVYAAINVHQDLTSWQAVPPPRWAARRRSKEMEKYLKNFLCKWPWAVIYAVIGSVFIFIAGPYADRHFWVKVAAWFLAYIAATLFYPEVLD